MKRGRPVGSQIRQRIVDILHFLGQGYGYQIHKIYKMAYDPCTREVIYYHLRKGVSMGEIAEAGVKREEGRYSWGGTVEKIYYKVGSKGNPSMDEAAQKAVEQYKQAKSL